MSDPRPLRAAEAVREDFDRLARLAADAWSHNEHYHPWLLRQLPPRLDDALEVGCGAGGFARDLAVRATRVLGLDLSPEMLRIARERSADLPSLRYELADVSRRPLPDAGFDAIVSIATLHHLPLDPTIEAWKRALRPGGTLLVLDLVSGGRALDLLALPAAAALRLLRTGRLRDPKPIRAAWDAHGRNESYLAMREVRALCARRLPGARARRHLLWRYSIVWRKQG